MNAGGTPSPLGKDPRQPKSFDVAELILLVAGLVGRLGSEARNGRIRPKARSALGGPSSGASPIHTTRIALLCKADRATFGIGPTGIAALEKVALRP